MTAQRKRRLHAIEGWKMLVTDDFGKDEIDKLRAWWDAEPRRKEDLLDLRRRMNETLKKLMYDGRIFHKDGTPYVMYRRGK